MTVVWLKDSGQAVTCLDCKYRETLLETLPKPKLKWHPAWNARRDEKKKKRENLIDFCRAPVCNFHREQKLIEKIFELAAPHRS